MSVDRIIRILTYPLSLILSIISIIFPKDKNLWIFGAWFGQRYSDNSRYLFEYVCINEPEVRAVWLTRNNSFLEDIKRTGKEVYLVKSLKGFWMALRANVVFVSSRMLDVNPAACYGALKVQLWHGIPLKKIGLDDKISENPDYPKYLHVLKAILRKILFFLYRYDFIISSSPVISERLASAFGVKAEQILLTGYPRNDVILRSNPPKTNSFKECKSKWNFDKIIFYAPTFRIQGDGVIDLFYDLDMQKLQKCLVFHNAVFFIKLHFIQRDQEILSNNEINRYRMHLLSEDESPDINYLLPQTDLLITDYSSVYFDYLLLNRPIIFTPFDIEQYMINNREFYEDYYLATPGPKCKNWDEVIMALDDAFNGKDVYKESRIKKQRIYNTYVDVKNCERVVKEIKSRL